MHLIRTVSIALVGAACALSAAPPSVAAGSAPPQSQAPAPSPQQTADLARIEAYLNGLTTAQAGFTMASPDGSTSTGQFSLSRPSKLRFEYTEPKGNLLIADGDFVIFWDAGQKDASNLPIGQTPLSFLLQQKISLTNGLRVTAFEHVAGVIRVQLLDPKSPDEGSVTVAFADQPMELRGWRLVDGQGQTTDVSFTGWKFGMDLASSLFHFEAPHSGKRGR
jgi:outer membrane lipoprotein-sorting protein